MTSAFDELQRIYVRDGALTPVAVVEDARPEDSPLHDRFEWDDLVAGELYRLTQAGHLIRSMHVTIHVSGRKEPERVRAWVCTKGEQLEDGELLLTGRYMKPADLDDRGRKAVLEQMQRDWHIFKHKYDVHRALLAELIEAEPVV